VCCGKVLARSWGWSHWYQKKWDVKGGKILEEGEVMIGRRSDKYYFKVKTL
jgi:hypothetical protein